MSGYLCRGTDITTTVPAVGSVIDNSIWTNYIAKANALPHVSDLAIPVEGTLINASYYNNIVNQINPPNP